MSHEWKALANAIVHDGYDPKIMGIGIRCDNCGSTGFYIAFDSNFKVPRIKDEESHISVYIMKCANCGEKEMNIFGTYHLPDLFPETILPFVGSYMNIFRYLAEQVMKLDAEGKIIHDNDGAHFKRKDESLRVMRAIDDAEDGKC
jgi:hypothetical protein